jgi:hypothetical protein
MLLPALSDVGPAGITVIVPVGLGSVTITPVEVLDVGTMQPTQTDPAVLFFPLPTLTTWYSYATPAWGAAPAYGEEGIPLARACSGERRFTVYDPTLAMLFHDTLSAVASQVTVTPVGAATRCAGNRAGHAAESATTRAQRLIRFIADSS